MRKVEVAKEYDNKNTTLIAGGVHIGSLLVALLTSWIAGLGGMLVGFVVWSIYKDRNQLIRQHAAEAFNFSFSLFLYAIVGLTFGIIFGIIFTIATLGIGLILYLPLLLAIIAAVFLIWIIFPIIAAMSGFNGEVYRYPFTIRILDQDKQDSSVDSRTETVNLNATSNGKKPDEKL